MTVTPVADPVTPFPPPVDPADVDDYFLTSFNGATWALLTPEEKDVALAEATRWLGTLCWQEADCCGREFTATYTAATAELALALHQNQKLLIAAGSATTTGLVRSQSLGELRQEFFSPSEVNGRVSTKAPLVLQRFPWLVDMLGCWITNSWGNSRVINRFRS